MRRQSETRRSKQGGQETKQMVDCLDPYEWSSYTTYIDRTTAPTINKGRSIRSTHADSAQGEAARKQRK